MPRLIHEFLVIIENEQKAKAMAKAPKNKMAKDKSVFAKKISNLIAQFCQNAAIDPVKGVSLSKLNKVDKRFTESISRAVRYNKTLRSKTSGRPKKSLVVKEKALKEILRPLWTTNTKRPRSIYKQYHYNPLTAILLIAIILILEHIVAAVLVVSDYDNGPRLFYLLNATTSYLFCY